MNPENGFRIKTIYQRGYRLEAMKAREQDVDSAETDTVTND